MICSIVRNIHSIIRRFPFFIQRLVWEFYFWNVSNYFAFQLVFCVQQQEGKEIKSKLGSNAKEVLQVQLRMKRSKTQFQKLP